MRSKSKEEVIREKKTLIEQKAGSRVMIEERDNLPYSAYVDWPNWHDKSRLPLVLHVKAVDSVHILHELVHLEKFFLEKYCVICHSDGSFSKTDSVFKNLPEDYVAHKVIKCQYGFGPIDNNWFKRDKDKLQGLTDEEIAANLVNFWAFTEFCPEYKKERRRFSQKCRQQRPNAFAKASEGIQALKKMDYLDAGSYNCSAKQIVEIFAPDHLKRHEIYPAYLVIKAAKWEWIDL